MSDKQRQAQEAAIHLDKTVRKMNRGENPSLIDRAKVIRNTAKALKDPEFAETLHSTRDAINRARKEN